MSYKVKDTEIRDDVRERLVELGYKIFDKVGTNAEFYDRVRTAGPRSEKFLMCAIALIEAKQGICLSTSYMGYGIPLNAICPKGHPFTPSLQTLEHGSFCPDCAGNKRKAPEEIRVNIEGCAFTFLDGVKTVCKKRHVRCPAAVHEYWVCVSNFPAGSTDPICGCKQCYLKK